VLKVLRDMPSGVHYHVRFPGRTLLVPENALAAVED
jgi:nitrogen fixation protein NifZ